MGRIPTIVWDSINLRGRTGGTVRTTCPNCSETRKKKKDPCLSVNITKGVAHCWNCDEVSCRDGAESKDYIIQQTKQTGMGSKQAPKPKKKTPAYPRETMLSTFARYDINPLAVWLGGVFGEDAAMEALKRYNIGTSKHWGGSSICWQEDKTGCIRAGKIMKYDPQTGRRSRTDKPLWLHEYPFYNKPEGFELRQCFFGEHLLPTDKSRIVALFEAERTAVFISIIYPELVCLATGGADGLNIEKCRALAGRKVVLYPDQGWFEDWSKKIKEIASELRKERVYVYATVSDYIEQKYLESLQTNDPLEPGCDLEDILRREDIAELLKETERIKKDQQPEPLPISEPTQTGLGQISTPDVSEGYDSGKGSESLKTAKNALPENSNQEPRETPRYFDKPTPRHREPWPEVEALETFFASVVIPSEPIRLGPKSSISDAQQMVKSHLSYVKAQNGNRVFEPYYMSLKALRDHIMSHTKKLAA